jgi:hypothetical protein
MLDLSDVILISVGPFGLVTPTFYWTTKRESLLYSGSMRLGDPLIC